MSTDQEVQVRRLQEENADVFAEGDGQFGCTVILFVDSIPVKQHYHEPAPSQYDDVKAHRV